MSHNLIASVPRLKGRENYREWAFAMKHFLALDKLDTFVIAAENSSSSESTSATVTATASTK